MRRLRIVSVGLLFVLIAYGEGKHSPSAKADSEANEQTQVTREPAGNREVSRPFAEDDVDHLMDEFAGMQGNVGDGHGPVIGEQPEKPTFEGLFD